MIRKTKAGYEITGERIVHRIVEKGKTQFVGKVWNAKRCTFDGRDYWLGAIETRQGNLLTVASANDLDGSITSAIRFCIREARRLAVGAVDIEFRPERV
jgi:hypothetical protein